MGESNSGVTSTDSHECVRRSGGRGNAARVRCVCLFRKKLELGGIEVKSRHNKQINSFILARSHTRVVLSPEDARAISFASGMTADVSRRCPTEIKTKSDIHCL